MYLCYIIYFYRKQKNKTRLKIKSDYIVFDLFMLKSAID